LSRLIHTSTRESSQRGAPAHLKAQHRRFIKSTIKARSCLCCYASPTLSRQQRFQIVKGATCCFTTKSSCWRNQSARATLSVSNGSRC